MTESGSRLAISVGGVRIDLVLADGMAPWHDRLALLLSGFLTPEARQADAVLRISLMAGLADGFPGSAGSGLRSALTRRLHAIAARHPPDPGLGEWCRNSLEALDHCRR